MTIKNTKKNISAEPGDIVIDVTSNTPSSVKQTSAVIETSNSNNKNFTQDLKLTIKLQDFFNEENIAHTKDITIPLSQLVRKGHLEANYYDKTNSYSKDEIDNKIKLHFEVWPSTTPPTLAQVKARENYENYIFLVPYVSDYDNDNNNDTIQEGGYREYAYVKNGNTESIEQIGSIQIDLTPFLKTTDLDTALNALATATASSTYKTLVTQVNTNKTNITTLTNDKADKLQANANAFVTTGSDKKIASQTKIGNIDINGKLYNNTTALANKILTTNSNGLIVGSDNLDSSKIINANALNLKINTIQNTAQSTINANIDNVLNTLYTTDLPKYLLLSNIKTEIWGTAGFKSLQDAEANDSPNKTKKLGDYIYTYLSNTFYTKTEINDKIASLEALQTQTLAIL